MRKHFLFLFATLICEFISQKSIAQIQNLFFSSYDNIVSLNFNSNPPAITYTGIPNGFEAIAHAEDGSGNVLFFVNSNGVYNASGALMTGSIGIEANSSSAEIVICPYPGDVNKFYIIYNLETCTTLKYSIVDMTLDGGLGDVINLNTLLASGTYGEGLEIVRIPCQDSFWLLANKCGVGITRFLINDMGISTGTLIMPFDNTYDPNSYYDGRGELDYHKFRLGLGFNASSFAFFCDFDPVSGVASNSDTVEVYSLNGTYGVEFSQDGSKAYFTNWYETINDNFFQYDFATSTVQSYLLSSTVNNGGYLSGPGEIELAPNGNLYVVMDGGNQINEISDANSFNPVITPITTTSNLALGISDHIQSDLFNEENDFTFDQVCFGDSTHLDATATFCFNENGSFLWNFGDPASGTADTSTLKNTAHLFTSPGNFTVTLIINDFPQVDTIIKVVNISPPPVVDLGADTTLCIGGQVAINAQNTGFTFLWSTNELTQSIIVESTNYYSVAVNDSGCVSRDTILVTFVPGPVPGLGPDKQLCENSTVEFTVPAGYDYLWSTGDTTLQITVSEPGDYWVLANNGYCSNTDTVNAFISPIAVFTLGPDDNTCSNEVTLDPNIDNVFYAWSTGQVTPTISVNTSGIYWVDVSDGICSKRDSIDINIYYIPLVDLGADINSCGDGYTIEAPVYNNVDYLWSTDETTDQIVVNSSGEYVVELYNEYCSNQDTVEVNLNQIPILYINEDTVVCFVPSIVIEPQVFSLADEIEWSTGEVTSSIEVDKEDQYIVTVTNQYGCKNSDTITVYFAEEVDLGPDVHFCEGDIIVVGAGIADTYLWGNGSDNQYFTIDAPGKYYVTANYGTCISSDTLWANGFPVNTVMYFPNTFTPNGDGVNDLFFASGEDYKEYHIQIFSRWGEMVFESYDPNTKWNGTYKNSYLTTDNTFVYTAEYSTICSGAEKYVKKGTITLIR